MTKLTENEKKLIIDEYVNGVNAPALAKKYGVTQCTILRLLHKNNIQVRHAGENSKKYTANSLFFNKIDNEKAAY